MTTIVPKAIEVNEQISFSTNKEMVVVQEIDSEKMSPFWCEFPIDDWQKIVEFINAQNDRKFS